VYDAYRSYRSGTSPTPSYHCAQDQREHWLHINALTLTETFHLQRPAYSGRSAIVRHLALTYTASLVVALAAWQVRRPDLIRSPKRVLAHLWEDSQL
jgi:hypothetical protein